MDRGRVAHVILGMLSLGPRSGYDIKRFVDDSTRHFWAASYGQIYPELRRLQASGLIEGKSEPRGGRQRTIYAITPAGRDALERWLTEPGGTYELRDERLLKLFFSDALEPAASRDLVVQMREHHEAILAQLRRVEELGKATGSRKLVLEYGIGFHQWIVEWCRRAERRLSRVRAKEVAS